MYRILEAIEVLLSFLSMQLEGTLPLYINKQGFSHRRWHLPSMIVPGDIAILVHNLTWFTLLVSPVWPVWPQHIHEGIEIQKDGGALSSCEER